jgi:negative regulator of flagellin synthesis FlgM
MNISNLSHIQLPQNIQGLQRAAEQGNTEHARQATTLKDSISFSEEALRLSDTSQTSADSPKIRFDLVNRIKAEIAAGTYDTPEKMDIALERMVSRIS